MISAEALAESDPWMRGRAGQILAPELILPEQFADLSRTRYLSGERRLFKALLEDAIDCLRKGPLPSRRVVYADTVAWVQGAAALVSFAEACEAFGLEVERTRAALLALRERHGANDSTD